MPADWAHMYKHVHRVRKIAFSHQRYTETGIVYRTDWTALSLLSHHVATARCLPGPFLPNLRVLHFDYYERYPSLWLADCFPHLAGRPLKEIHLHCDEDFGPEILQLVDLSVVLPLVAVVSPNLKHVSIWDSRNHPTTHSSNGISGLLAGARSLQRFTSSLPIRKVDIGHLAVQPQLSCLSIVLLIENPEGQLLIQGVDTPTFASLESLALHVANLNLATAFIKLLKYGKLRKLRISTPMWFEETELQDCFRTLAQHLTLQELAIAVVSRRGTVIPSLQGAQCIIHSSTIALLFGLPHLHSFSLSAQDRARFETDLDDAGVEAMAKAWRSLRSLSIVQGSWAPLGISLPPPRTTLKALLFLRDNCPRLSGLSIGLDTTSLDLTVQQAAAFGGDTGHSLRKLNIDSRSTPVSNPEITAMILHGLFPELNSIHDGSSMLWNEKWSDWQEVGSILRNLNGACVADSPEYDEYSEPETEY